MNYPRGHEFEYRKLQPSQIKYDPLYQRDLDIKRVDRIVREFDGDIFNEPKVSYRDGCFWCFNGQHSIAAWRKLHNGEDCAVNCKVYTGMTWLDECEAFVKQNGINKDPTTNEKLRAAYNSKDSDVVSMVNIAHLVGYTVDFSPSKIPSRIVATSALFKAYKMLGQEDYRDMLTVLRDAWWGDMDAVQAQMIKGLATFFKTYKGGFKVEDLTKSLKNIAPCVILRNGKQFSNRKNTYCHEIAKQYNIKRRTYRVDESKLG